MQVFSSEEKISASIKNDPMSGGYLLQLILGLVVVILCIVALSWLTKRMQRLQSSNDGALKVLGGLSMSARERVVLLQVGDEQLLLGVSPGRINTLHVLDTPVDNVGKKTGATESNNFADKLSAMISGSVTTKDNASAADKNQKHD